MTFYIFGINFHDGDKSERWFDNFAIGPECLKNFTARISVDEFFIFKSNKTLAILAFANQRNEVESQLIQIIRNRCNIQARELKKYQFSLERAEALRQFYKYSIGLENQGEFTLSLQEFRQCFEAAREANFTGPYLHKLYQRGVWLAEKVRLELNLRINAVTPETVVIELAQKIFGDLKDHKALIAASDYGFEDFAQKLLEKNIGELLFANSEQGNIEGFCERFGGRSVSFNQLKHVLPTADLIALFDDNINHLLGDTQIPQIMNQRNNTPLLLVSYHDLTTQEPLDKDNLSKIYNLYYYHKHDLDRIVAENLKEHLKVAEIVDQLIDIEIRDYLTWMHSKEQYRFGDIIGKSQAMQKILELVARIAQTDISVIIDGESGTGKELVARAIHEHSTRAKNPFVVVNCGAMSENLLESELFGHVRGAFTGAMKDKKGLFEVADHGSIFLDEIGETSLSMQVKLLRFLQDGEIKPVGSNQTLKLDVRLITATNRNLEKMVQEGTFRQDLYYRLNVIQITIPPLRDRKEDIPPLVEFFIKMYSARIHKTVYGLDEEAAQLLPLYDWPGNVRELENAIERAVALSLGNLLTKSDFPPIVIQSKSSKNEKFYSTNLSLKELERSHIAATLEEYNWNYDLVTKILGIGRTTLWRKMKAYNLHSNQKQN